MSFDPVSYIMGKQAGGGGGTSKIPASISITLTSVLTVSLYYVQSVADGVLVDWGDGSSPESTSTLTANITHTYGNAGDYTITLTAVDGAKWQAGSGNISLFNIDTSKGNKAGTTAFVTSIDFGESCASVDNLQNCTAITSLTFQPVPISFSANAFNGDTALKSVYIFDLLPWCLSSFGSNPLNGGRSLYLNDEIVEDLVLPNELGDRSFKNAFSGCASIKTVTIPSSIKTISANAFKDCDNLTALVCDDLDAIEDYAFYDCDNFTVDSLHSAKSIGAFAFWNCNATIREIPNTVSYMGAAAFSNVRFSGGGGGLSINCTMLPSAAFNSALGVATVTISASNCRAVYTSNVTYGALTMPGFPFYGFTTLTINVNGADSKPTGWDTDFNKIKDNAYATVQYTA